VSAQGVVLFHTTSAALRAEKVAAKGGLSAKLIPTPRHLSSDCGISLCFDWPDKEKLAQALEAAKVPTAGIYPFEGT